jgi:hypothetical protein
MHNFEQKINPYKDKHSILEQKSTISNKKSTHKIVQREPLTHTLALSTIPFSKPNQHLRQPTKTQTLPAERALERTGVGAKASWRWKWSAH